MMPDEVLALANQLRIDEPGLSEALLRRQHQLRQALRRPNDFGGNAA